MQFSTFLLEPSNHAASLYLQLAELPSGRSSSLWPSSAGKRILLRSHKNYSLPSKGDESANRRLVEILYPAVRANVRNHLRTWADHDDVSQEIFLKIFLRIEQYRGPQPFSHWVSRIAVTTCYDWLRKQRVRPLVTHSDLSEPETALIESRRKSSTAETSDTQRELFSGLLEKLIATLKPREQIVIRLLDLEERSVREIATLTGWGLSKIKVTAMRARRKLAEQIQQLETQSVDDHG